VELWEKRAGNVYPNRAFDKLVKKADALGLWYDPSVTLPEGTEEV
jgi:hypothetical protein